MRVTYRYIRPMAVFFARSMGEYQHSSREAWGVITRWLDARNMSRRVRQRYGILRDNPKTTGHELLRYDACVPVIPGLDADPLAGIGRLTLPGGAYAVHTHVGSYQKTGRIFSELHREVVPKNGLTPDTERPSIVIYLNDPTMTREMHRRTEICVPVVPLVMPFASNDDSDEVVFSAAAITPHRNIG